MKPSEPRKLSFDEAWESTTEFFVDDSVEKEVDKRIEEIYSETGGVQKFLNLDEFAQFLRAKRDGLDAVLADIGLPKERFKRIITLLRRKGKFPGGFDQEWGVERVKSSLLEDDVFLHTIASTLFRGKDDPFFQKYLPKYYREKLNWKGMSDYEGRKAKIKETIYRREYANIRGRKIEEIIGRKLEAIKLRYRIDYGRGRSRIVDVNVDWAVPNIHDP